MSDTKKERTMSDGALHEACREYRLKEAELQHLGKLISTELNAMGTSFLCEHDGQCFAVSGRFYSDEGPLFTTIRVPEQELDRP